MDQDRDNKADLEKFAKLWFKYVSQNIQVELIITSGRKSEKGFYLPDVGHQFTITDEAIRFAEEHRTGDVWLGINPRKNGTTGRGGAKDLASLCYIALDIDLPLDDVRELLTTAGLQPMMIVASGHGGQPWFRLTKSEEPTPENMARLRVVERNLIRKLNAPKGSIHARGPAGIVRMPGTMNTKELPVPVQLVHIDEDAPPYELASAVIDRSSLDFSRAKDTCRRTLEAAAISVIKDGEKYNERTITDPQGADQYADHTARKAAAEAEDEFEREKLEELSENGAFAEPPIDNKIDVSKLPEIKCNSIIDLVEAMKGHGLGHMPFDVIKEMALHLTSNTCIYFWGPSGTGKSYTAERFADFDDSISVGYLSAAGLYQSADLDGKTLLVTEWDTIMSRRSQDTGTEAMLRAQIGAPPGAKKVKIVIGSRDGTPQEIDVPICRIIACSTETTRDEQWRTRFHMIRVDYTHEAYAQQSRGAPRLDEAILSSWRHIIATIRGRVVVRDMTLVDWLIQNWKPNDGRQTALLWTLLEAHARFRGAEKATMDDYRVVYEIVRARWTRPPTETAETIWDILVEASFEGTSMADLIKASHRSERTVKRYLHGWRDKGLVNTNAPSGGRAARWILADGATMPGDPELPAPSPLQQNFDSRTEVAAELPALPQTTSKDETPPFAPVMPPNCDSNAPVLNGLTTGAKGGQNEGNTMTNHDMKKNTPSSEKDGGE